MCTTLWNIVTKAFILYNCEIQIFTLLALQTVKIFWKLLLVWLEQQKNPQPCWGWDRSIPHISEKAPVLWVFLRYYKALCKLLFCCLFLILFLFCSSPYGTDTPTPLLSGLLSSFLSPFQLFAVKSDHSGLFPLERPGPPWRMGDRRKWKTTPESSPAVGKRGRAGNTQTLTSLSHHFSMSLFLPWDLVKLFSFWMEKKIWPVNNFIWGPYI